MEFSLDWPVEETRVDSHLPVLVGRAAYGDSLIAVASSLKAENVEGV